jgi:DNA-binding MarR family transcriptional regulator
MNYDGLSDKDFKILETIHLKESNQRDISRDSGFSLGMVNIILKRLIHKGYVKIQHINKKRMLYYLTPKAIEEKTRNTVRYIRSSIQQILDLKYKIKQLIQEQIEKGARTFTIVGSTELADVVLMCFLEIKTGRADVNYSRSETARTGTFNIYCDESTGSGEADSLALIRHII